MRWPIAGRKYLAGPATAIRSRKARFGAMFEHDARCQVRQGYQRERYTAYDESGEQEDESQPSIDLPVTVDQIALGPIGGGVSFHQGGHRDHVDGTTCGVMHLFRQLC